MVKSREVYSEMFDDYKFAKNYYKKTYSVIAHVVIQLESNQCVCGCGYVCIFLLDSEFYVYRLVHLSFGCIKPVLDRWECHRMGGDVTYSANNQYIHAYQRFDCVKFTSACVRLEVL